MEEPTHAGDRETIRAYTGGATSTMRHRCWSSTPDDLLAMICRMLPSTRDRVRVAAVCRPWRRAALPGTPWLLLSKYDANTTKSAYCPEDGTVLTLPSKSVMRGIIGGHDGGWLVSSVLGFLRIVNFFSGVEVMLSRKQKEFVCPTSHHVHLLKTVFSEAPTSGDCILATMTLNFGIALCRIGCIDVGWTIQGSPSSSSGNLTDITFCNGELYGINHQGALFKFEIGMNKDGASVINDVHRLAVNHPSSSADYVNDYHIFDLHGKLAMAFKTTIWPTTSEPFFKVFQLVDDTPHADESNKVHYKHKWLEVTSLYDYALFLGHTFSKAVHVPANTRGEIEKNRIYYTRDRDRPGQRHSTSTNGSRQNSVVPRNAVLITCSNDIDHQIYYGEDDMKKDVVGDDVKRIKSIEYFTKGSTSTNGCMWILPPGI